MFFRPANHIRLYYDTMAVRPNYKAIFKDASDAAALLAAFILPKFNFRERRTLLPSVFVKEYRE